MPRTVAMIPVLLGSTRVPDKNLLLVNGKILCSYSIDACKESNAFDDIYLNYEDDVFSTVAKKEGVLSFPRHPERGGSRCTQSTKSRNCAGNRCILNDHFLYDFMSNSDADYVCLVNSTSPLLKPQTIQDFVRTMQEQAYDSFFATNEIQAESLHKNKPVNFDPRIKCPSQELLPIQSICWAISGWKRRSFIDSYERDDPNEAGPVFLGQLGTFPIDEREAMDIDNWSTLELIRHILTERQSKYVHQWGYLDGRTAASDSQ